MIAEIKTFIFSWGSLTAFWGLALFLCCCGTETILSRSWRKVIISLLFFPAFYFLVSTYGVPRYFIYDHVPPIKVSNINYYPAVKNHLIFQSRRYQTFGIMSQDLSDFKAGDDLFLKFKIKPLNDYKSIKGLKTYTNELLLLALLLTWWLLINKLHNVSVASKLYKAALKSPTHANFTSYLNASEPLKRFQILKRRKATKALKEIKTLYISVITQALKKYQSKASLYNLAILQSIISDLQETKMESPSVKVNSKLSDKSSEIDIEKFEKNAQYKRDYCIPSESQLSNAIAEAIAETLNLFLPEKFITTSTSNSAIEINSHINCAIQASGALKNNEKENCVIMLFGGGRFDNKSNANLHLSSNFHALPKVAKGNQAHATSGVANTIARYISQQIFTGSFINNNESDKNTALINQKLSLLKDERSDFFIKLYKTCKSEIKGELSQAVIQNLIEQNRTEVDSYIATLYEFTTEHSDVFFELISQEIAFSFVENIAGEG